MSTNTIVSAPPANAVGRQAIWLPWVLGCLLIPALYVRDIAMTKGGLIGESFVWGRDFVNVWTGGQLIRTGDLHAIYDLDAYMRFQDGLFPGIGPHNYSYPPVSYPLATLLSYLPYTVALVLWLVGTGLFFIWAARPWLPAAIRWPWLAALTPAALVNIWAGHYGFLIGGLFLLGWRWLDERPARAGLCFGLLLIKPHLAVLVPLILLIRGDWRAIASAAATVLLLIAATAAVYGWQPWLDYLFRTSAVQAGLIDAGLMFFRLMSTSTATAAMQLGASWPLALLCQGAAAALGLWLVVRATIARAPTASLALLAASCTFLVLPYGFNYDLTVVAIAALTVMARNDIGEDDRRLARLGFLAPQFGMALAAFGIPAMPLLVAALAIAQYRVAIRDLGVSPGRAAPAAAAAAR